MALTLVPTSFDGRSGGLERGQGAPPRTRRALPHPPVRARCAQSPWSDHRRCGRQGVLRSPYPLTVPAATTAPTAVKFFNAAANTGIGTFTITPTIRVTLPANTYTSTLTTTLVSGP